MLLPAILIADQQTLFVDGLTRIIREKLPHVDIASASSVTELLNYLEHTCPQAILLNFEFIDKHFNEIRPALERQHFPEIITLCDVWTDAAQKKAASLGALGVLGKNCSSDDLWRELDRIIKSTQLGKGMPPMPTIHNKTDALTSRQRKILQLLASGLTNREISDRIGCAETTVKAHLNIAYKILGVKNRTQAMVVMSQLPPLSDAG